MVGAFALMEQVMEKLEKEKEELIVKHEFSIQKSTKNSAKIRQCQILLSRRKILCR